MWYIDENYRTNADRDHRAFCGFSMGGCTTWNVLMYDLKDFATVIPLSGDCWAVEQTGGKTKPAETAQAIAEAITAQGMTADDFRIFAATGSVDTALENLAPQMIAMRNNEMFRFGENTFFGVMEGISHGDPNSRYYLYTGIVFVSHPSTLLSILAYRIPRNMGCQGSYIIYFK